jgi:hypothetical protein
VRWADLEAGAPELAAVGREEFARHGMALVGTLRRDGRPRISCIDPVLLDGELYLGMMWRSRKAVDLLRDPRLVVHNAICTNTGLEVEFSLHGHAEEVDDAGVRGRFVVAAAARSAWRDPFHLFRVALDSAAVVRYASGHQHVRVWPGGIERRRTY